MEKAAAEFKVPATKPSAFIRWMISRAVARPDARLIQIYAARCVALAPARLTMARNSGGAAVNVHRPCSRYPLDIRWRKP